MSEQGVDDRRGQLLQIMQDVAAGAASADSGEAAEADLFKELDTKENRL
jgi:hypothetical protein